MMGRKNWHLLTLGLSHVDSVCLMLSDMATS